MEHAQTLSSAGANASGVTKGEYGMKIEVFGYVEEYPVCFKRFGKDIILDNPPEELLVSLCGLSQLPIDGARLPRYPDIFDMLIATTSSPEIDDTYGENEYPIEVTYDTHEIEQIKMLFDHEV